MKKILAAFCLIGFAAYAANEITVNWSFSAIKGPLSLTRQMTRQLNISAASPLVSAYAINVTTAAAGTAISGVTSNGWSWFVNSSTNYSVDIGTQVAGEFYPVLRVGPNEGFPCRTVPLTTNYARANSGTNGPVVLECPIIDN